jgi:large subunit ribosomal protein L29
VVSVKPEDLRTLDTDELSSRLKGARRELYELRFKLAVGQLDDHRQIRKVRKDIARILTVVHARRLDGTLELSGPVAAAVEAESVEEPVADAAETATGEETPENVETADEPQTAPASRRTRRRDAAGEEGDD